MDKAEMIFPRGIETAEINARKWVTLLTGVKKGKENRLLFIERDRLRRGVFAIVLRRDKPIKRAMLYCLPHLLIRRDHVLCYSEVVRCPLVQIRPYAQRALHRREESVFDRGRAVINPVR